MALIECPNCGKKISDSTDICIHCKYDLKKAKAEEKAKKSFFSIPKDLQKQYENEFCCSNKTFKKIYKFRRNYLLYLFATLIGVILCMPCVMMWPEDLFDIYTIWARLIIILSALLLLIMLMFCVLMPFLNHKLRKGTVIYYTEFAKWLRKNKQLELNYNFGEKEKKIYNTLYPKGDK